MTCLLPTDLNVPVWQRYQVDTYQKLRDSTITAPVVALTSLRVADVAGAYSATDGGGGQFIYDPTSVAADDGATVLQPTTGSGRWLRQFDKKYNVKWFGAKGDGTTNDSSAIQAALDAVGHLYILHFPRGRYSAQGLTVPDGVIIEGDNAILLARSNNATILTVPGSSGGLQAGYKTRIHDLTVTGNGYSGVTGIDAANNDNFTTAFVTVESCYTGWNLLTTQFATHIRPKAFDCTVGFYVKNAIVGGGGNSNSYYDLQAINNQVGVIVNKVGPYPVHSNYFRNASLLGNTTCALAVFGGAIVTLDGSANESNASGTDLTYDSLTVKTCSLYVNASTLDYINSYVAEAAADPCIILDSGATLFLHNLDGYGATKFVTANGSSKVIMSGKIAVQGSINNVVSCSASPQANSLWALPVAASVDTSLINDVTTPQTGDLADANGATASALGTDLVLGEYQQVQYAASIGTQDTNRANFTITVANSGLLVVGFNVISNMDTTLSVGIYGNINIKPVDLKAGIYYRICWLYNSITSGGKAFIISPATAEGATVKFSRFQATSASLAAGGGLVARVAAGGYNPKVAAQRPQYSATAAPTTGTWIKGDVVWHSNPASGGNIGWVCTTAGSPGTWKAFGTIA